MNKDESIVKIICTESIYVNDFIGGGAYDYCKQHNLQHLEFEENKIYYCSKKNWEEAENNCGDIGVFELKTLKKLVKSKEHKDKTLGQVADYSTRNYMGHQRQSIENFKLCKT